MIEKFCTDFIEKSVPLDEKTKKMLKAEDNMSARADKLSDLSSSLDQTLTSEQIKKQIDDKLIDTSVNQSMVHDEPDRQS